MTAGAGTEGTTDKVAEAIRAGIRTGQFVPGQHLVEIDLTQRLSISRSSLREALRHLQGDGIVVMNRYRGTHIGRLTRTSVIDLLEVLEQLSRLAARRAAASTQPKQRLMDAALAIATQRPGGDRRGEISVRQAFYDVLFDIAGNDELLRVAPLRRADLLRAQIRPYQPPDDPDQRVRRYRSIAEAVLRGDAEGAEDAVHAHFDAARDVVKQLPEEAF